MSEFNLYDGNDSSTSNSYTSYSSDARSSSGGLFSKKVYTAEGGTLSLRAFYGAIMICLLWGFAVNAIICTFFADAVSTMNPIAFLIFYFVSCIAGIVIYKKSDNPVISFVGYNLIVLPIGITLSLLVSEYSTTVVKSAFTTTAIIVTIMTVMSFLYPDVFKGIFRGLSATLLVVIIADIVMTFVFHMDLTIIDYVVALIFSLYIAVDLARAQDRPYTLDNAVDTAAELYLDIINLFIRILRIMAKSKD